MTHLASSRNSQSLGGLPEGRMRERRRKEKNYQGRKGDGIVTREKRRIKRYKKDLEKDLNSV